MDDGSTDGTFAFCQNYEKTHPTIRAITLGKNSGKGAALKRGIGDAKKDWVLLYDADGATPIKELEKFLPFLNESKTILIGSRDVPGAKRVINQNILRQKLGLLFVYFRKWIVGLSHIQDTQCGFKLLPTSIAKSLFDHLQTQGFLFDVEILGRAQLMEINIREIGVQWFDVPKSKVSVFRELPKIPLTLFKIRKTLRKDILSSHTLEGTANWKDPSPSRNAAYHHN